MKIQPTIRIHIVRNAKDYNRQYGTEENPITSFDISLIFDIDITQINTFEEGEQAERLLHFIDNNYELIKNRFIERFKLEAKNLGFEFETNSDAWRWQISKPYRSPEGWTSHHPDQGKLFDDV